MRGLRSGASHVSGLFARHVTAGPDVVGRSGSNQKRGLDTRDPVTEFPDQRIDRLASHHHHPSKSNVIVRRCFELSSPSPFRRLPRAPAPDKFRPWP